MRKFLLALLTLLAPALCLSQTGTPSFNLTYPISNNSTFCYNSTTGFWENGLCGGGSGTVTSVSVVTANGYSGTVANATTTPEITISGPPIPTSANPSATIGLTAINGSSTTYMRSDAAPALSQSLVPTMTGLWTFTGGVISSGSLASPSDFNVPVPWLQIGTNLNGTQTYTSPYSPITYNWNYALDARSSANGDYGESHVVNLNNGWAGNFGLLQNSVFVTHAPLSADSSNRQVTVNNNFLDIEANLGGTALNQQDAGGRGEPFNSSMTLEAAATDITSTTSSEMDTNLKAGSSSAYNVGILSVLGSGATNRGAYGDYALNFSGSTAGVGWKDGISFGGIFNASPFQSDSTYIQSERTQAPVLGTAPVADTGINFEPTTFTNNFVKSQGFEVGPLGNTNVNNLELLGGTLGVQSAGISSIAAVADNHSITGGCYFDSASIPTLVIQASSGGGTQAAATVATLRTNCAYLTSGGTGYAVNDVLTQTGGTGTQATITVNTVNGSGVILTYTITTQGSYTAISATPGVTGGTGTGATFEIGYGIVTTTVGTAGTLYAVTPPPVVWASVASHVRNIPAVLAATMSAATEGTLTLTSFVTQNTGNISAADWGANGIFWNGVANTITNTTSTGTEALLSMYDFPAETVVASNATTYTELATLRVAPPVCSTNCTGTTIDSIYTTGEINAFGLLSRSGIFANGAAVTLNKNSNFTVELGDGSNTQTVTIGGGSNAVTINATTLTLGGSTLVTSTSPVTLSNATIKLSGLATSSAAQTGTVCSGSLGLLTVDTTTTCLLSAARFKQAVEPLDAGLSELRLLKPISYELRPEFDPYHLGRQVGFIAEDVEQVDKRLVGYGPDGQIHGVRYLQMAALLAAAGIEQDAIVQTLKDKVDKQQLEIYALALWALLLTGGLGYAVLRRRS